MEFRLFLISVFLVLFNLSEGLTNTKTIPTTKGVSCPIFTVYTQPCVDKGGKFIFYTNGVGCRVPTCIYPETTTSTKTVPTSTTTLTKTVPTSTTTTKTVPTSTTSTKTVPTSTTSTKTIPTSTTSTKRVSCPTYTVYTKPCVDKGGKFTYTTNAVGCRVPTCIYPETTTTTKTVPTSTTTTTKTVPTSTTSTKTIPTSTTSTKRVSCPTYTVYTKPCVDKGGKFTYTTNAVGCRVPTCIYPETTTTTKTVPTSTTTTTKTVPTSTTSTKTIPTSTTSTKRVSCPTYTVYTKPCVDKGGKFTYTTNAVGCRVPTCIYPETTTTTKTVPTSTTTTTKTVPTSTTSTKTIPTSTTSTKRVSCPTYTVYTKPCVDKGGKFTYTTNAVGCRVPTCIYPETTTTTKTVPTSTTTTTKTVPTSTTSTKTIPTSTTSTKRVSCPTYTVYTKPCVDNGGIFTYTTNAVGCRTPTCIYPETTTTTKTVPTSTTPTTKTVPTSTTSTKTIPTSTSTCKGVVVTVTKKEKVTVTLKETVYVTIGSSPTDGATGSCAKKWEQCGGVGFNGPTCCESGSTCHEYGKYYSQCI